MGIPVNSYDPNALGASALSSIQQGSWMNTGAAAINQVSNAMSGMYQARVAMNNYALAKEEASADLMAGETRAQMALVRGGQEAGAERAGYGAGNIDVDYGSAATVQDATKMLAGYNSSVEKYNAMRQAYRAEMEASAYKAEAGFDRFATYAGIARDAAGVYGSFISGSTALTSAKANFSRVGVGGTRRASVTSYDPANPLGGINLGP